MSFKIPDSSRTDSGALQIRGSADDLDIGAQTEPAGYFRPDRPQDINGTHEVGQFLLVKSCHGHEPVIVFDR